MQNYIIVFIGAGLGGVLRYWAGEFTARLTTGVLPYGTLAVNVLGSFIIGLVMYYFHASALISLEMRLLLTTGFCGGLTTFSTFSYETMNFLKSGDYFHATYNIAINVILTLLALVVAYKISKMLSGM